MRGKISRFSMRCLYLNSALLLSSNMIFWRALPAVTLPLLLGLLQRSLAATTATLEATEPSPAPRVVSRANFVHFNSKTDHLQASAILGLVVSKGRK